ncbi:hypothetical protein BDY21DRAFT_123723 [Lineolata rhizophorae]|uniref:Uncharacterized protein n=1 Tax=Lineolata rhizophorae TaxID=578093 RepID=A0A6A6NPL6_9PEZI|nr:hypothetical protein BDY21DRAFT_123723 [Lineolata rhizophorae]
MLFLPLLFCALVFRRSFASPITSSRRATNPTDSDPPWVESPDIRGTYDLVLSCLTTLSLCAWTAYHPNVHPQNSMGRTFLRRLWWMTVAVFVPEIVLFCAWEQCWAAKRLRDEVNRLSGFPVGTQKEKDEEANTTSEAKPDENRRAPWSLEQAFFALSGGIAVASDSFWTHSKLTFTPAGIVELARVGHLPNISLETVADKSKANTIAKVLVCVQASWFFVQSMARLASALPLTLLELHILTHIACALCIYLLWMKKPYDVESAIVLDDEDTVDMAALFAADKRMWSRRHEDPSLWMSIRGSFYRKSGKPIKAPRESTESYSTGEHLCRGKEEEQLKRAKRALHKFHCTGNNFEFLILDRPNCSALEPSASESGSSPVVARRTILDDFSPTDLGSLEFRKGYVVRARSNMHLDKIGAERPNDIRHDARNRLHTRQLKVFTLLNAVYGGTHLAAWNSHFPSTVEMWMWRAAGLAIVGAPAVVGMTYGLGIAEQWFERPQTRKEDKEGNDEGKSYEKREALRAPLWRRAVARALEAMLVLSFTFLVVGFSITYPVGRLYVLVESFASLRSPPAGTYATVQWSEFIPHAG